MRRINLQKTNIRYLRLPLTILLVTGLLVSFPSCKKNPAGNDPTGPIEEPKGDENPPEKSTGTLEIGTITTGEDDDPDGYVVEISGVSTEQAEANGQLKIEDLEPGSYNVELKDIARHCVSESENPATVQVTENETTSVSFEVFCPAVLRNTILFLQGTFFDGYTIMRAGRDGGNQEVFVEGFYERVGEMDVSPDGTKVVLSTSGSEFRAEIWVMDIDGSNRYKISPGTDVINFWSPRWSPDGTQIVFYGGASGTHVNIPPDIYVAQADGSEVQNITNSEEIVQSPLWRPDGEWIYYTLGDGNGAGRIIMKMKPDGTQQTQVLEYESGRLADLNFTPDGESILFMRVENQGSPQLLLANLDGSVITNVTEAAGLGDLAVIGPRLSPDGKEIVFTAYETTLNIHILEIDGSNHRAITFAGAGTENSGAVYSPVWRN